MKKTLLGLGTLACVAIPVTATIACSFDDDEKEKVPNENNNSGSGLNGSGLNGNGNSGSGLNGSGLNGSGSNGNGNSGSSLNGSDSNGNGNSGSGLNGSGSNGNGLNGNGNSGSTEISGTFNDYSIGGIHILDQSQRMNALQIKNKKGDVRVGNKQLDSSALAIAKNVRETMNKNSNTQWHTYGDPIIDGINAIRLAIHNDINGDQTLKNEIKQFADASFSELRNPDVNSDNVFSEFAKKQINDWFDSNADLNILPGTMEAWGPMEAATRAKDLKGMTNAFAKREVLDKNYGALTLGTPELSIAQHRVQEIDWLGEFDGHDHGGTINKIKNNVKIYNNHPTGEFSKAPIGDGSGGNENYVLPYTYNNHKFEEGGDFTSGLLTAIDVLYDSNDGSGSTGHRTNFYSKDLTTFGWSRYSNSYGSWKNYQYLITESGREQRTNSTDRLDEIKKANPFLNEYSIEMLKVIPIMDYLCKINVNKEYLNLHYSLKTIGLNQGNPQLMEEEFFKPHASFDEFEEAIRKAQTNGGYHDYVTLKQPDHAEEITRLSNPQQIGKPDTWVKTYDYNGGGSITGHQYGYSPIDSSLF